MGHSNPTALLNELLELRNSIIEAGQLILQRWRSPTSDTHSFHTSAQNLAYYLALQHHDMYGLQRALMPLGLSLNHYESRVLPALDAVIASLRSLGEKKVNAHPSWHTFFEGEQLLHQRSRALLGDVNSRQAIRIMVTLPSDAANNYDLLRDLLNYGVKCLRINCAHDGPDEWGMMVNHLRRAEVETGQSCRLLMDLGGIQARTADITIDERVPHRVHPGDRILLTTETPQPHPSVSYQFRCTIPDVVDQLDIGQSVWIDDGQLGTRVIDITSEGIWLEVSHARPEKGEKLKDDKGMNFPDTDIFYPSLREKDRSDLDFIATHADIVGHSFVQTADDIQQLIDEIKNRGDRQHPLGIIAKIETSSSIHNLPDIIMQAIHQCPFGVMIARGDLAVEVGYQRMAELQEKILWTCKAAHIPVIWATDVLRQLAKKGTPSRAEITDAVMAGRSECVMLNKGAFILDAVTMLDDIIRRTKRDADRLG
ncbi:MAG: pyruvate kinase [Elainellaceae cyanobacterium]